MSSSNPSNPNPPPSNSPTPPNLPQPPSMPTPPGASFPSLPDTGGSEMSSTAWAQMFPGGATPQQFRQFMNTFMQMMIYEFKRSDQEWQQAQQNLKEVEEGNDPDSNP